MNARLAFRLAHGWSQGQVADQWNERWPDELKTFKSISAWELWPGGTGHAPSFDSLGKLAQLYQCSVGDLLADLPDYRGDDVGRQLPPAATDRLGGLTGEHLEPSHPEDVLLEFLDEYDAAVQTDLDTSEEPADFTSLAHRLQVMDFDELAQVIAMWIRQRTSSVSRREVLSRLSAALTVVAAAPLFDVLAPDEQAHVARMVQDPAGGFDEPTLRYCEGMVNSLRRQGDVLGPQRTLHSAVGHRQVADQLTRSAPATLQGRAVSAYAELTQFIGWLCFNMGDYRSAERYYDEARSAAHEVENVELVTYVLCAMSQLATWRGKPRVGIDHAAAAAVWARNASPRAQAYAADVAVRAYAADHQPAKCRETLDGEYAGLIAGSDAPVSDWWYFYDESFYWRTEAECALKLHQPEAALQAIDKSLVLVDPANLHNYAFRQLFRAEAWIQQGAVDEAADTLGDVGRLATMNSTERIVQRLGSLRAALTPWERTEPVRRLDERLALYRPALGIGSGRTNRTYLG
jgi:tetratricopeptide (TPR) repeat protein/transcriptional regulator with XRE-family HTH domain